MSGDMTELENMTELEIMQENILKDPDARFDEMNIVQIKKKLDWTYQRLLECQEERTSFIDRIYHFNQMITERDSEITNLNQALAERDRAFHEVVASRSWRITRPLRWLARVLRGDVERALDPLRRLGLLGSPIHIAEGTQVPVKTINHEPVTPTEALQQLKPLPIPSFQQRFSPHLTVVAMARNEAARVHDTMRHFCALFDRVVLIDHLSEDSTADIARGYDGVADTQVLVMRGDDQGYYQSEYMSSVANALLVEGRTDWIFFLDFDEFLPFNDASSLRQTLVSLSTEKVIHCHWYNLALVEPAGDSLQGAEVVIGKFASDYVKIALNARLVGPGVVIEQGNHAVRLSNRSDSLIGRRAFGLLHVPISGPDALQRKVRQGVQALSETTGLDKNSGSHWRDLANHICAINDDNVLARQVALNYGKPMADIIMAVSEGRLTEEARRYKLYFAQTDSSISATVAESPCFSLQNAAETLSRIFPAAPSSDPLCGLASPIYSTLQTCVHQHPEYADRAVIDDALLAASTDVEVIVPNGEKVKY